MLFEDIIQAVDKLSQADRQRLRQYLDHNSIQVSQFSPEERIRRLNEAMDAMREGLTQDELDEMTAAMNEG